MTASKRLSLRNFAMAAGLGATVLVLTGCTESGDEFTKLAEYEGSGDAGAGEMKKRSAKLPVAPDEMHFMWQGMQTEFLDEMGQPCTTSVAIAVGNEAVCYAAAGGELRCAGEIDASKYGPSFVDVGVSHVQQILLSPTINFSSAANFICVNTTDGLAQCMGNLNHFGQFGTGNISQYETFVPWGGIGNVHALATKGANDICAVTEGAGPAYCAGSSYGTSPALIASGASSLWFDFSGKLHIDDGSVFRVSTSFNYYAIMAQGFGNPIKTVGTPGDVVDGNCHQWYPLSGPLQAQERYCWLNSKGKVRCSFYDYIDAPEPTTETTPFQAQPVLALAGTFYNGTLCAVYADGSIACMGRNEVGQLGLPPTNVDVPETVVQPPGSVDVTCKE